MPHLKTVLVHSLPFLIVSHFFALVNVPPAQIERHIARKFIIYLPRARGIDKRREKNEGVRLKIACFGKSKVPLPVVVECVEICFC